MGRNKVANCDHAYYRASERCGWSKKEAQEMMRLASKKGLAPSQIKDNKELKKLLMFRQLKTNRRIKYYKGYIFIFASTSTRCYTVYKNPLESEATK